MSPEAEKVLDEVMMEMDGKISASDLFKRLLIQYHQDLLSVNHQQNRLEEIKRKRKLLDAEEKHVLNKLKIAEELEGKYIDEREEKIIDREIEKIESQKKIDQKIFFTKGVISEVYNINDNEKINELIDEFNSQEQNIYKFMELKGFKPSNQKRAK